MLAELLHDGYLEATISIRGISGKMSTQQTFTCSKSIIETIEKDVKYVEN